MCQYAEAAERVGSSQTRLLSPLFSLPIANSCRVSYFFFMLWNWASHRRSPVEERHDSFLERFRDPDLKEVTSREINTQAAGQSNAAREKKWVDSVAGAFKFHFSYPSPQVRPQTNRERPWNLVIATRLGLELHGLQRVTRFIAKITERGNLVLCISHKLSQQVAACNLQHEQLQQHRQVSLSTTTRIEKKEKKKNKQRMSCVFPPYLSEIEIEEK